MVKAIELAIKALCLSVAIAIIGVINVPDVNRPWGAGTQPVDVPSLQLNDSVDAIFRSTTSTIGENQRQNNEYAINYGGALGMAWAVIRNMATGNYSTFVNWGAPKPLAALLAAPTIFIIALFSIQFIWRMTLER